MKLLNWLRSVLFFTKEKTGFFYAKYAREDGRNFILAEEASKRMTDTLGKLSCWGEKMVTRKIDGNIYNRFEFNDEGAMTAAILLLRRSGWKDGPSTYTP